MDRIEAGSSVLLNNQVDQLVSAMATYNIAQGAGSVIPQDVKDELSVVLAADLAGSLIHSLCAFSPSSPALLPQGEGSKKVLSYWEKIQVRIQTLISLSLWERVGVRAIIPQA